jgi:predicted unusual protein kinase regulating ubiquinone biosynthesis (AarF/ABC1/UbiB family)
VNCLARIFPKFTFVWLAEETERNLPIELDFLNEGKNIEKVASIFRKHKFVKVIYLCSNFESTCSLIIIDLKTRCLKYTGNIVRVGF